MAMGCASGSSGVSTARRRRSVPAVMQQRQHVTVGTIQWNLTRNARNNETDVGTKYKQTRTASTAKQS